MKLFFTKSILWSMSIVVIGILFTACNSESQPELKTNNIELAELLQRGDKIQMGKEWDAVQSDYSTYKNKLKANPNDNETKILLAKLYIKEARVTGEHGHYYPGALAILEDALTDSKIDDDMKFLALTTKAGVQLSLHEFQDALATGEQAVKMNALNAQIYGVLVDANVELGNYKEAVAMMDRMMAIKPDIRSYSRVSYLREIHGDYNGSIEAMNMAVKSGYPGNEETAWAMQTLGDIYQQYGEYDKALKIYNNILALRPDYPFAVGAIGDVQLAQGNLKEAEKTLTRAMNIIPEVGFYVSMAHLYKQQDRTEELDAIMSEIMVMLKEDTDSGHNMNMEYADLYLDIFEDSDEALRYAQMEYEKRPDNIDVNRLLAKVYKHKNDDDKLAFHLNKASTTGSLHPELGEIQNG